MKLTLNKASAELVVLLVTNWTTFPLLFCDRLTLSKEIDTSVVYIFWRSPIVSNFNSKTAT